LAVLLGIWSVIMGILEIIGGLILRRMVSAGEAALADPTGSAMSTG
jgi:hypothetical protein